MKSEINKSRIVELCMQLKQYCTDIHGLYLDSVVGFSTVYGKIMKDQGFIKEWTKITDPEREESLDNISFDYEPILPKSFCNATMHQVTHGEVKERNRFAGTNLKLLGRLCLVSLYSFWDENIRPEYAKAKGVAKNDIKAELWGDIRILRHCILHNNGIADNDINKCVRIRWYNEGDEIFLTSEMMGAIFSEVYCFSGGMIMELFPDD